LGRANPVHFPPLHSCFAARNTIDHGADVRMSPERTCPNLVRSPSRRSRVGLAFWPAGRHLL